jgi:hypothetical protein
MTLRRKSLLVIAVTALLTLIIARCVTQHVRQDVTAPAVRAAAADLAAFVREGWHLPVSVSVGVTAGPDGAGPAASDPRVAALAVRQLAAVKEAQARAAFDFFAVDVEVGAAEEPTARVSGEDRRISISLPAPGAEGGAIVEAGAILEALAARFAWDAVGRWYPGEPREELLAALRRDLGKVDALEETLAVECRRLEMVSSALSERARSSGQEPILTPSESVFARGAQVRATFALHRLLNTIARWRAAAQDPAFPLPTAAKVVLRRAREVHEAHLAWLLDVVVGVRPVLAVWEKEWWHRHPLYKALDASAPLDFVDMDGAPPGSIPEGSVRALLLLRYDGAVDACYAKVDAWTGSLDPATFRGAPLGEECAAAFARSAKSRAVRDAHAFGPFQAWKETWDARLKEGFSYPFYQVVAKVSTFLGDTRTSKRPPALRGERLHALEKKLRPGDILLVRQDDFLSNAFLPGFLPHAVLWLGEEAAWTSLALEGGTKLGDDPLVRAVLPKFRAAVDEHGNPARAIEAVSEGVLFSSLEHAMSKDYVAALRPELPEGRVAAAIRRGVTLLGRPYDFDFDFATDDRIVCTELVYHAYNSEVNFRVQVDAPPPGPKPRVPGVLPVVGRLTMPANELARYALHMQERPEGDAALGYPGRRLSVLFFADRKDPEATVYEGPEAVKALKEAVER